MGLRTSRELNCLQLPGHGFMDLSDIRSEDSSSGELTQVALTLSPEIQPPEGERTGRVAGPTSRDSRMWPHSLGRLMHSQTPLTEVEAVTKSVDLHPGDANCLWLKVTYAWGEEEASEWRGRQLHQKRLFCFSVSTPLPRSFYYEINNSLLSFVFNLLSYFISLLILSLFS